MVLILLAHNLAYSNQALDFQPNQIQLQGVAIECRINAEHPVSFVPSPGTIAVYHPPSGPNIRVDSHFIINTPCRIIMILSLQK